MNLISGLTQNQRLRPGNCVALRVRSVGNANEHRLATLIY